MNNKIIELEKQATEIKLELKKAKKERLIALTKERLAKKAALKEEKIVEKATNKRNKEEHQAILRQKKEAKAAAKAEKKATQKGSVWDRMYLSVCEKFEEKACELKFKMDHPEAYEANQVLQEVESSLEHFEKKLEKKGLKESDHQVVIKLYSAVSVIVEKDLSTDTAKATDMKERLINIMPDPKAVKEAEQVMEQIANLITQEG